MYFDVTNREITAGCVVVSPQRKSSSIWLAVCDVVRIDESKGLVLRVHGSKKTYYHKGSGGLAIIKDAP
jgi:hypothetical protein